MRHLWSRHEVAIAMLLATAMLLLGSRPAEAGHKDTTIEILRTDIGNEVVDSFQYVIASIVNDVLAQSINKVARREHGAIFFVRRSGEPAPDSRKKYNDLINKLRVRDIEYLVLPELQFTEKGYVLRVGTIGVRHDTVHAYTLWRAEVDLDTEIIGRKADFADIERKIFDLARGVTRRIMDGRFLGSEQRLAVDLGRAQRVLFWCVSAIDTNDNKMDWLSRLLTLQMPYFLTNAAEIRQEAFSFVGLSPKEYYLECLSLKAGKRDEKRLDQPIEEADVIITADVYRKDEKKIHVNFLLTLTGTGNNRPLLDAPLQGEDADALKLLADEVVVALAPILTGIVLAPIDRYFTVLENAMVRARPTRDAEAIDRLLGGSEVFVLGKVRGADWYKVHLRDERNGYVYAPLLRSK